MPKSLINDDIFGKFIVNLPIWDHGGQYKMIFKFLITFEIGDSYIDSYFGKFICPPNQDIPYAVGTKSCRHFSKNIFDIASVCNFEQKEEGKPITLAVMIQTIEHKLQKDAVEFNEKISMTLISGQNQKSTESNTLYRYVGELVYHNETPDLYLDCELFQIQARYEYEFVLLRWYIIFEDTNKKTKLVREYDERISEWIRKIGSVAYPLCLSENSLSISMHRFVIEGTYLEEEPIDH